MTREREREREREAARWQPRVRSTYSISGIQPDINAGRSDPRVHNIERNCRRPAGSASRYCDKRGDGNPSARTRLIKQLADAIAIEPPLFLSALISEPEKSQELVLIVRKHRGIARASAEHPE